MVVAVVVLPFKFKSETKPTIPENTGHAEASPNVAESIKELKQSWPISRFFWAAND